MAKFLVANEKSTIENFKKARFGKTVIGKVRLFESLESLQLSELLTTYGQIYDVLIEIEKHSMLSQKMENSTMVAGTLSNAMLNFLIIRSSLKVKPSFFLINISYQVEHIFYCTM